MIITPQAKNIVSEFEDLMHDKDSLSSIEFRNKLKGLMSSIDNELDSKVGLTPDQADLFDILITG